MPSMQVHAGFQLSHVLLVEVPQLRSGSLVLGYQKLEMMTEGVMNPFGGFINKVKYVFLELLKYVYMIVHRYIIEEVYDGRLSGIFV